METDQSDQFNGESNQKRLKIESGGSTSSKPEAIDPFLSLPSDILAKIIGYTPIGQWRSLESLDNNFRATTLIAWRQLRYINLDRELSIKRPSPDDIIVPIESILQKLLEHSPFMTSMSGINIQSGDAALNSVAIQLIAQFEHLESITLGDAKYFGDPRGIPLENVIEFLELTRSRTSLKELRLFNVVQLDADSATILDRFASSFANGRENQAPLKLEKLLLTSPRPSDCDRPLYIRLDTLDTSRLSELRLRKASIEPDQLTSLIERAPGLHRIELSFLNCLGTCNEQYLQANTKLLTALASHENLTAIKFECYNYNFNCKCLRLQREFIDMLKSIGLRGRLRELAFDGHVVLSSTFDTDEIGATIRDCMPYLRSLKIYVDEINEESVFNVLGMTDLEELHFSHWSSSTTVGAMSKIAAHLPHLKRLAIDTFVEGPENSLEWLADVSTLTDLRIRYAKSISADVLEKWGDGFASNLDILMLGEICERMDEKALVRLLTKAGQLRVFILNQHITEQTLKAIADSCPKLETLGVRLASSNETTVQYLQEIVDRCPRLKQLGGFKGEIRNQLRFPKYRKIDDDVDMEIWSYDFGDDEYD